MWYCDPFGDLQHLEPREIVRLGHLDFNQCRLRQGEAGKKPDPTRGSAAHRGLFD